MKYSIVIIIIMLALVVLLRPSDAANLYTVYLPVVESGTTPIPMPPITTPTPGPPCGPTPAINQPHYTVVLHYAADTRTAYFFDRQQHVAYGLIYTPTETIRLDGIRAVFSGDDITARGVLYAVEGYEPLKLRFLRASIDVSARASRPQTCGLPLDMRFVTGENRPEPIDVVGPHMLVVEYHSMPPAAGLVSGVLPLPVGVSWQRLPGGEWQRPYEYHMKQDYFDANFSIWGIAIMPPP